ncbi:MAG: PAS domain-containing sensor histidine kinase [Bacteroidota bacterium]|uniref:histidine kinase n=1 Tax=Christiangramia flava JLT2011 TaxID=1229726 RepID=A0A1L7I4E6_9FLAO|nr:PAS domain-containing sensor histidine kinase [Christiangramia flava]APU67985.1 Two-component hybrid sensor and regulator [Christiangramia flava JLT2011]MEE2772870.1 PAS domain-containing sensor histidine kinase [Bacteroidota bacterium]OSS40486.1 histidine kinase sensor protein [Christiangramia flava JLT2011]
MLSDLQLNSILEDFDIAYWKVNLFSKEITWSEHFNALVGNPEIREDRFEFFINQILHADYRYDFRIHFEELLKKNEPFSFEIKLKLANGKYRWFECKNLRSKGQNFKETAVLLFVNIHQSKRDQYTIEENFFYYRETAEMTSTGGWYIDTITKNIYWDDVSKKILDCPRDFQPRYDDHLKFYAQEHHSRMHNAFDKCENYGIPFKLELKMVSFQHREFWVGLTGKPVYNDEQQIVGIRGVIQNIDENKNNELNLQNSLDIIASQNSRLFNFAHIVSHHLRSHSSNLSLIVELLGEAKSDKDKLDLLANVEDISGNLDTAISRLNDIVSIQTSLRKERVWIKFEEALEIVLASISSLINRENAKIVAEFQELKEIRYVPEYLESILLNLITNAIRYRQPGRKPVIFIQTYIENEKEYLEISDNGMGIDLEEYGDKMFGMYKTFHQNNPEAKGIGLFITKNQVEALGGTISVSSTIDIGTTFKIKF